MPKFHVLLTDYAWPYLDIERSTLADVDAELHVAPSTDAATLAKAASACHAVMTTWAPITADVIEAAPNLRIVARLGIGLDNIAVDVATERGVLVTNVPGYCVQEVAEHALALILALARRVGTFHHATKQGIYDLKSGFPLHRLADQTLGIVGFGGSGRELARRALGIGLRVVATSRTRRALPEGVEWRSLDELLSESDFVSLHAPLSAETRHLVDAKALARMKRSAYLINTARGGLVDHRALVAALASGDLAGAALDVQEPEPPDLALPPWNDPRVIVTPHAAFASEESLAELRHRASHAVAACLTGKRPADVVNPKAFARRG